MDPLHGGDDTQITEAGDVIGMQVLAVLDPPAPVRDSTGSVKSRFHDIQGLPVGPVPDSVDGQLKWKTERAPRFDKGGLLLADDVILIVDGFAGYVYMLDPTPEGFKPIQKAKVLAGSKIWAPHCSSSSHFWRCSTWQLTSGVMSLRD